MSYKFLYHLAADLHAQQRHLQQTCRLIVSRAGEAVAAPHGCLLTFREGEAIDTVYVLGAEETAARRDLWEMFMRRGLAGHVYHSERIVVIRNVQTDPRWAHLPDNDLLPQSGAAIGVPLRRGAERLGVLVLLHPQVDYFSPERVDLLDEVARVASDALANALARHTADHADTRYQTLFEHTLVPLILTDKRGIILDLNRNACEMLGCDDTALHRQSIHTLGIDLDATIAQLAAEDDVHFRCVLPRDDDAPLPVLVRARRLSLGGRSVVEWLLQDMRSQLEMERLHNDLTAMVYHDLRGPLQNILASQHRLQQLLSSDDATAQKLLSLGVRSAEQLQRLVDSLLDIQQIESGTPNLKRQTGNLRELLDDTAQTMQPSADQAAQAIDIDVAPDVPPMAFDRDMIQRVLMNLIDNALKYSPDGSRVTVNAQAQDDAICVRVRDAGPGIPPEMHERIFDKFSRVRYNGVPKGLGLGLAFCRLAVEAHEGRIWVESDGQNGSEFCFTLPLRQMPSDDDSDDADDSDDDAWATSA